MEQLQLRTIGTKKRMLGDSALHLLETENISSCQNTSQMVNCASQGERGMACTLVYGSEVPGIHQSIFTDEKR